MEKATIKTAINAIDNAIKMFEDILEVNRKNSIFSRSAHQRIQSNILNLTNSKHNLEKLLNETLDEDWDLINEATMNLKSITHGRAPDYIKALAQNALNNLTKIKSDLEGLKKNIACEHPPRCISKMLQQSKTTDEELSTNEDNIRVVEFKNEDQAEDFVESLWNK